MFSPVYQRPFLGRFFLPCLLMTRLLGRKMPQIRRRRCSEAVPGRKRHLFLRGMGYQLPAEQKNTPNPAQKVLRGGFGQKNTPNPAQKVPRSGFGQKKASFPARNGVPPACRAGKCPKSCAEGAPRQLQAEKGIFSCAEWGTTCLPSRKMPQIRRGRCSEGI